MEFILDSVLVTVLVLMALIPLWVNTKRSGSSGNRWMILPALGLGWVISTILFGPGSTDLQHRTAVPKMVNHDGYVGSKTCVSCHQQEHDSWFKTYHRTMTQVASTDTIEADFDGRELKTGNTTYQIFMQGDQHWVRTPDPHWELNQDPLLIRNHPQPPMTNQRIVMVTGSHKMHMFWISLNHSEEEINLQEIENNTLVLFPWVYMIADDKWIPYEDSFIVDPSFGRPPAIWNKTCIACHTVQGRPKLNKQKSAFQSDVVDFGIACEACHGPGQEHVSHFQNPLTRYQAHLSDQPSDSHIIHPLKLSKEDQVFACGQCHSLFEAQDLNQFADVGMDFQPQQNIHANHKLLHRDNLEPDNMYVNWFWNDKTIRIGGREYQGLALSKCYLQGEITCLSCHSMHSMQQPDDLLKPKMNSNHACIQCHPQPKYQQDIESHTHHPPDSDGSLCYNCHMPHTSYALMGGLRSHRIDIPGVSTVEKNEKPNACNLCHLDKPLQWTADQLTQWYGHEPIELKSPYQDTAAGIVWIMQGNAIHRTLAAWHMSWGPTQETSGTYWRFPFLLQLLNDNYSATRYVTWQSLNRIPAFAELTSTGNATDPSYDFIGSVTQRSVYQQSLMNRWMTQMGKHAEQRPELLIQTGTLDQEAILELFKNRDNTKILMSE